MRDSIVLPLLLSALREDLMKPEAYETFRERFQQRLRDSQGAAEDQLRVHDARTATCGARSNSATIRPFSLRG